MSTKNTTKTKKYSEYTGFFIAKFVNVDIKIVFIHAMSKLNMLEKNSKNANTKRCFDEFFFGKQQKKNGSKQTKNIVRSLYLKPGMHKVFDTLYHHGKTMYRHAHKHHKKYLWGVA